jgi:hypothetical protein
LTPTALAQAPIQLSAGPNFTISGNRSTRKATYSIDLINGSPFSIQVRYDTAQSLPDGIQSAGQDQSSQVTLRATGGTAALSLSFSVKQCTPAIATTSSPLQLQARESRTTAWTVINLQPPSDGSNGDTWQNEIVNAICPVPNQG